MSAAAADEDLPGRTGRSDAEGDTFIAERYKPRAGKMKLRDEPPKLQNVAVELGRGGTFYRFVVLASASTAVAALPGAGAAFAKLGLRRAPTGSSGRCPC